MAGVLFGVVLDNVGKEVVVPALAVLAWVLLEELCADVLVPDVLAGVVLKEVDVEAFVPVVDVIVWMLLEDADVEIVPLVELLFDAMLEVVGADVVSVT